MSVKEGFDMINVGYYKGIQIGLNVSSVNGSYVAPLQSMFGKENGLTPDGMANVQLKADNSMSVTTDLEFCLVDEVGELLVLPAFALSLLDLESVYDPTGMAAPSILSVTSTNQAVAGISPAST